MQSFVSVTSSPLDTAEKKHSDLLVRLAVAIPALLLLAAVIYFHGLFAKITVSLIHLLCVQEILNAVSSFAAPIRAISYGFPMLLLPAFMALDGSAGAGLLLTFGLMLVFIALLLSHRKAVDGAFTVLPMLYPGLFFASIYDLLFLPEKRVSQFLLIVALGCAVVTDTFAYLGGSMLGRHKLIERVSPHKTVEGALCGLLFGAVYVYVIGSQIQPFFGVRLPNLVYAALGILLSVFSQFGDLAASYLKRLFGIKDFGRILGPHGGMLDRLDSMLFLAPIVNLFYRFCIA